MEGSEGEPPPHLPSSILPDLESWLQVQSWTLGFPPKNRPFPVLALGAVPTVGSRSLSEPGGQSRLRLWAHTHPLCLGSG